MPGGFGGPLKGNNRAVPEELLIEAAALYEEGHLSIREVAAVQGVCFNAARNRLILAGVQFRPLPYQRKGKS